MVGYNHRRVGLRLATDAMMQLSVNKEAAGRDHPAAPQTLAHLKSGESGILDRLDLPEDVARRLMELGFLPGHTVVPARSAPGVVLRHGGRDAGQQLLGSRGFALSAFGPEPLFAV